MSISGLFLRNPIIFGSFKVNPETLNNAVKLFKVIDAATGYKNLSTIGSSISHLPETERPIILLKFNPDDFINFDKSVEQAVAELGKEPEIVLIHSPLEDNVTGFKQLSERFPNSLKGVSNFNIKGLQDLMDSGCKLDIVSLEYSPYYQPKALIEFCRGHNIIVTGYRCLAKGEACKDPLIISLAEKYKTSTASILLTWSISNGVLPIYTTNNINHMNVSIVHDLSTTDIQNIDALDQGPSAATCMLRYTTHDYISKV